MLFKQKQTRHLKRYREIATILARHGLGWLALELNLGGLIPFHRGLLGHPKRKEPYTQAEHMRMALEDLGATFIKLGQILSTRPDLVPPEYIIQFSKLQDSAPPFPYAEVAEIIQKELGAPPEKIFKVFETQPRASASIGQVHNARLKDDSLVVVKVQRPGVEALIEQDLEVLGDLARFASQHTELGAYYDVAGWFEEFAFVLRNELDYTYEAHNALTMTYEHGFFHADPHPGNLFVLPNEVIAVIDYGMVGRLDENLRLSLLRMDMALIRKDADKLMDELMILGISKGSLRRHVFKRDLDHFIQRFYDKPLKEITASQVFNGLVSVALRHRLQLPSDLIVLFKVIAMREGLGAQLDPDFKLMEFAEPFFKRFWLQSRSLGRQVRKIAEGTQELAELSYEFPRHARHLLGQLERGEVTFIYRLEGLQESLRQFQQAANRVSMSILAAALVIGLGLLMLIYHPPGWEKYAGWFFGLLFIVIVLFNIGLLWKIWRSGR